MTTQISNFPVQEIVPSCLADIDLLCKRNQEQIFLDEENPDEEKVEQSTLTYQKLDRHRRSQATAFQIQGVGVLNGRFLFTATYYRNTV